MVHEQVLEDPQKGPLPQSRVVPFSLFQGGMWFRQDILCMKNLMPCGGKWKFLYGMQTFNSDSFLGFSSFP